MTPRRYGPGGGTGHRKQAAGRLRSIGLTEGPFPAFADRLRRDRAEVERRFGHLTNWGADVPAGLGADHRRVRRWVQAKLVLTALKRQTITRTYVG